MPSIPPYIPIIQIRCLNVYIPSILSGKVGALYPSRATSSLTNCIVHAVRLKVSKSVADDRCQNLFWRVWSSYTLSRTISTSLLIHLWQCCQKEPSLESFWLEHNLRSRTPEGQQQVFSSSASDRCTCVDSRRDHRLASQRVSKSMPDHTLHRGPGPPMKVVPRAYSKHMWRGTKTVGEAQKFLETWTISPAPAEEILRPHDQGSIAPRVVAIELYMERALQEIETAHL